MASRFDVTTPTTTLALDANRIGLASFTVTSTDPGTVSAEAIVVAGPGAASDWFSVKGPSRTYPPGQTDQVAVAIAVPADAPAGAYSFRLRVLLAGGVPEEDFDDSPSVSFEVVAPPEVVPEPVRAPKKPFPWRLVALVGAIVIGVVGVGAFIVLNQEEPARIALHAGTGGSGEVVCELDTSEGFHPLAATEGCQDEVVGSLTLSNVPAATRIEVFGSPSCTRTTDWADVQAMERVQRHVVDSFEAGVTGPPVSVAYHPRTGPWRDVLEGIEEVVATRRLVPVGEERARPLVDIREVMTELVTEVEAAGGEIVGPEAARELTPETLAQLVAEAAEQGKSAVFVDATGLDLAQREELVKTLDPSLRDIIWWPGGPNPEGLNGKVSCVRVSRVSA